MEGCDLLGKLAYKLALRIFCQICTQFGNFSVFSKSIVQKECSSNGFKIFRAILCYIQGAPFYKACIIPKKSNRIIYWYFI